MEEWKPKFKVGDKVKVVDSLYGHEFSIGEVVIITKVDIEDQCYDCKPVQVDEWILTEEELELWNS